MSFQKNLSPTHPWTEARMGEGGAEEQGERFKVRETQRASIRMDNDVLKTAAELILGN